MSSISSLIFGGKVYGEGWTVKSETPMAKDDCDLIREVHVVAGDYGLQLCMFLKAGGQIYKKISRDANFAEGQVLKPEDLTVQVLSKSGEADIVRFK